MPSPRPSYAIGAILADGTRALRRVRAAAEISPRLLDLADAARYLSMGDKSLRKLIQKGELPFVQTIAGRSPYLLDIRDLDRWIEKSKQH